jgi:hypothetical protein
MSPIPSVIRAFEIVVRKEGVEPPRPHGHRILSPARLPIPPLPLRCSEIVSAQQYTTVSSLVSPTHLPVHRKQLHLPPARAISNHFRSHSAEMRLPATPASVSLRRLSQSSSLRRKPHGALHEVWSSRRRQCCILSRLWRASTRSVSSRRACFAEGYRDEPASDV